jgi:quercetin dioxygenase-like cupin family protein
MTAKRITLVGLVAFAAFGGIAAADSSGDKTLLDNEHVLVMEYVFPPGFKGDEHVAPVNELAYVLDGQFAVVTKGKGTRVVKKGEIEYAPRGTVHYSVNDSKRPARVLVVLLKER